jgi:hypothetical protein
MPFEIRMSMFLVECEALNDSLVQECNDIIKLLLDKAAEYVSSDISQKVTNNVRAIINEFNLKPSDTESLVKAYDYLETVKSKTKNDIVRDYNEVMDWMLFLYNYPQA